MFRRSRFSIRPNVGGAGRAPAPPPEPTLVNQEASRAPSEDAEGASTSETDNKSVVIPSENVTAAGDTTDQNVDGTNSSTAVQRRKRFSIKPKVAPGRPATFARTPKCPVKAVTETPDVSGSDPDLTSVNRDEVTADPQELQSPRQQRPSQDSKTPTVQSKPSLVSSESSEPATDPAADASLKQTFLPTGKKSETSQVKVPLRPPDKVPPSIPDKETAEISEKAKTLLSSKSAFSSPPPKFSLSRLLNDPSDVQRLEKARKLRELLRQEMHKEKKMKREKTRLKEYTLDPAKMTMRDLIRYLPLSNPMSSSLEDSAQENETVVPGSPESQDHPGNSEFLSKSSCRGNWNSNRKKPLQFRTEEATRMSSETSSSEEIQVHLHRQEGFDKNSPELPENAQEPHVTPKKGSPRGERQAEEQEEDDAAAGDEDQEEALMVPQVKVAEDGSLIIDEESLTVEVQRAKGPNTIQDRDPIFERGSTTTYSSFRKGTHSKPWSSEETDMFFLAISMVGTDFSMICQLFPHRARSEIKNKFKKEERENAWRIDKAFRERRKLDIEYFSKLLEKIMEVQRNRKKVKSISDKNTPKKPKRMTKGKKAAANLSDVEENKLPDPEEKEGEKENEDATPITKSKRKRKKQNGDDISEKNNKRGKRNEKETDEACLPEDTEAALPENHMNSDMSGNAEVENAAEVTAVKPAKVSQGRAPKPLVSLGRRLAKKALPLSSNDKDGMADEKEECKSDGASEEKVNEESSPSRPVNEKNLTGDSASSEDEDYPIQPSKPTRYGRVPKPTKLLNYPAKEDIHPTASETTHTSPARANAKPKPKTMSKRGRLSKAQSGQEAKKPKLVTLRASQLESSDEEGNENQREDEDLVDQWAVCNTSKDSSAPAFVPASLRSPQSRMSEVEEAMEELDIFNISNISNIPDVLGISQDALCPDTSSEQAQNETPEPCEHQLDLLVDVIDFLSSEHTEASEVKSYNEAAQTLLEIGNQAHLSQSTQNNTVAENETTGNTSGSVVEISQHQEEISTGPNVTIPSMAEASDLRVTDTKTVATVDQQDSTSEKESSSQMTELTKMRNCDQTASEENVVPLTDSTPQLVQHEEVSKTTSSLTKRGHSFKLKPKPNIDRVPRIARPKSTPEKSPESRVSESQSAVLELSKDNENLSSSEQTTSKSVGPCPSFSKDDIPPGTQSPIFSEVQATGDKNVTEEKQFPLPVAKGTGTCNLATSDTTITETKPGSSADLPTILESSSQAPSEASPPRPSVKSEDSTVSLTRKSRLPKVKPNLPQRSRPRFPVTKDPVTENTEATLSKIESLQTCNASDKPSQIISPNKVLIPSLAKSSTPTEELISDDGKSDGNVIPDTAREAGSRVEVNQSPVQGDSDGPSVALLTEESSISQKEESKVKSIQSTRKGRFQKPKPNLPQRSRALQQKLSPATSLAEEDTSSSKKIEPTNEEMETTQACTFSPQTLSQSVPMLTLDSPSCLTSTHVPTEEVSVTEEEKKHVGPLDQVESGSEKLDVDGFGSSLRPCSNQMRKDTVTDAQVGQGASLNPFPLQEGSSVLAKAVEELPVGPEEDRAVDVDFPRRSCLALKTTPEPNVPEKLTAALLKSPSKHDSVPHVQLPDESNSLNLVSTDSAIPDKERQPTSHTTACEENLTTASILTPVKEFCSAFTPNEEPSSNEDKKTDAGLQLDPSLGSAKPSTPQRRRRFLKAKPNLGLSTRTTMMKAKDHADSSEKQHTDVSLDAASEQPPLNNTDTQSELQPAKENSNHLDAPQLESLNRRNDEGGSFDNIVTATSLDAGNRAVLKENLPDSQRTEKTAIEDETTECDVQQKFLPKASEDSPESKNETINTAIVQSDSCPKESTQQEEITSEIQSQGTAQTTGDERQAPRCTDNTGLEPLCEDSSRKDHHRCRLVKPKPNLKNRSRLTRIQQAGKKQVGTDSGICSEAISPPCSGKLVSEVQPVILEPPEGAFEQLVRQESPQNDTVALDGFVSLVHEPFTQQSQDQSVSSIGGTHTLESLGILPDMMSMPSDPDEPFFILSLTEIPVCTSGESTDGASEPLPYLPGQNASVQPQSVPEERLAATDNGSVPNVAPSVPAQDTGETGPVTVKVVPPDPVGEPSSACETPADPNDSTTQPSEGTTRPPVKDEEFDAPPPKKTRTVKPHVDPNTTRRQVSTVLTDEKDGPTPIQEDQEPEVAEASGLPEGYGERAVKEKETSSEPQVLDDHVDTEKNFQDSDSPALARTSTPNRKPKGFLSFLTRSTAPSEKTLPGKAASKRPKVKTPQTKRKRSTPTADSGADVVAPGSAGPTQLSVETLMPCASAEEQMQPVTEQTAEPSPFCSDQTPSTSLCMAQVTDSQQSYMERNSTEVEPTCVSEYFLSDIFTEVEEED